MQFIDASPVFDWLNFAELLNSKYKNNNMKLKGILKALPGIQTMKQSRMEGQPEIFVNSTYNNEKYCSGYCGDICCAELVRNCCVNLGIDPDMEDGLVLNIDVYLVGIEGKLEIWKYKPSTSIVHYAHPSADHPAGNLVLIFKARSGYS